MMQLKKAYILTALEYIKEECKSHSDDIADEHDRANVCEGCPLIWEFFVFSMQVLTENSGRMGYKRTRKEITE